MIKITINNRPIDIDEFENLCDNYYIDATLSLSEDATTEDAVNMFYKALLIEGYHNKSIVKALYNVAKYYDNLKDC